MHLLHEPLEKVRTMPPQKTNVLRLQDCVRARTRSCLTVIQELDMC